MWVPWFGHFCPPKTRFVSVLTLVFMITWPRQNRPLAKKDIYWITRLSKYIMEPMHIDKPHFEYMAECEFHDVADHNTKCVSNVTWVRNVFSQMPILKCFDQLCWILLKGTQCRATVYSTVVFSFISQIFTC